MADRARQDHSGEQGWDARVDRAREVGLFRYALIRTAADPALSTRQRGRLVRDLAAREHTGPFGERVRISRVTIDRWILVWRRGGFDALLPSARYAQPRTAAAVLELAAALKREVPARTAAQVRAILLATPAPPRRSGPCNAISSASSSTPARTGWRRGRSAGSRPPPRTSGGPVMRCTARSSPAARPTYKLRGITRRSRSCAGYAPVAALSR